MTFIEQLKQNCTLIAETIETTQSLQEYLNNILEINYIVDSRKNYLGSELLASMGEDIPTITIDTRHNTVNGYWKKERFTCYYIRPKLDYILQQKYESI